MFTILIVEDNAQLREVLHETLCERFPFPVLAESKDVEDALTTIDAVLPDVIFVDINLPDGNGFDLIRQLRAERNDAFIAVLTGHDSPQYKEAAIRSGADHYLVKGSASLDDIFSVVESAIASRFKVMFVADDAEAKLVEHMVADNRAALDGGR